MEKTGVSGEKQQINVGFIGAGNIAKAIGISILNSGIISPSEMYVCAPTMRNLTHWLKELKVNVTNNSAEVVVKCDVVFLAMKPYQLNEVFQHLSQNVASKKECKVSLFISVLAATSLATIRNKINDFSPKCELIRVIPNTSMEIGEGCCVMCSESTTPSEYVNLAKQLLTTGGICEEIPENLMSIAGSLSGSGPAFMYLIIEALSDGAVKKGLPRELSYKLAAQMMSGASKMVLKTGHHPAKLKDGVCSPNGTTICGIHVLEKCGVRSAMMDALEAATERSFEISKSNH